MWAEIEGTKCDKKKKKLTLLYLADIQECFFSLLMVLLMNNYQRHVFCLRLKRANL